MRLCVTLLSSTGGWMGGGTRCLYLDNAAITVLHINEN